MSGISPAVYVHVSEKHVAVKMFDYI